MLISFKLNNSTVRKINKNNVIVFKSTWTVIQPADGKWCSVKKDRKAEDLACTMQIYYELKIQTNPFPHLSNYRVYCAFVTMRRKETLSYAP